MLASALFDGPVLDPLAPFQDACAASEVDVGRGEVVQALVIAAMIIVLDEASDGALEIAGQVVVLEQDSAFPEERCQRSILPWFIGS